MVTCQCAECDCTRKAKDLSYVTSSWLVCMSCCLGRHAYIKEQWCPTCDQRLPMGLSRQQQTALAERLAKVTA